MKEEREDSLRWMKAGNLMDISNAERRFILTIVIFFLVLSIGVGALALFLS